MTHIPALITDLALILVTAGVTTLLFKKINQPLVLGYIVAGVLVGPAVSFTPTVGDSANVTTWADIGVIFLMFSLGLEFSLHKLAKVGKTAILTAGVTICGMLVLGFCIGSLMGWGTMNSIFLGGMISMSSTIIILKAFSDMELKGEDFTEGVLGVLVLEDVAAIFLMVVLSTIAVSQGSSGGDLAFTLGQMAFYLALWMILGIYIVPTFLEKTKALMNDETLLVVSLGICFGMVWLANVIGFSSALGAFLAGSILAGTVHAERIEHLVSPCKDLFAAVFFVSVGMMVSPEMLLEYKWPILAVTLAVVLGQIALSTAGMLLAGKNLSNALKGGFCLCQIGEFSFIIASLGLSLGVTADFLYPIVVAVSVITTFTTPYLIASSGKAEALLRKLLPDRWVSRLERREDGEKKDEKNQDWPMFLKRYITSFLIYGTIVFGIIALGTRFVFPFLADTLENDFAANIISTALILIAMAPFIRPLLYCRNRYFSALFIKSAANRFKLVLLSGLRAGATAFLIMLPLSHLFAVPLWVLALIALVLAFILAQSDRLSSHYLQMEARFLSNFNERRLHQLYKEEGGALHRWLDEQLMVGEFRCPEGSKVAGKTFGQGKWSSAFHVNVIKVVRGRKHVNVPDGNDVIREGDHLFVMGEEKQLENFRDIVEGKGWLDAAGDGFLTLRQFIEGQAVFDDDDQLFCYALPVQKNFQMAGKSIKDAGIKTKWNCLLIGMERNQYPMPHPNPNRVISAGDVLWILGTQKAAGRLLAADLSEEDADGAGGGGLRQPLRRGVSHLRKRI